MARLGPTRPTTQITTREGMSRARAAPAKNAGSMLLQTEEEPDQSKPRRKKLMGGPA